MITQISVSLSYSDMSDMKRCRQKVKSTNPGRLPSTERAAYYHTLRVHLQILIGETLDNNVLDPLEWGWSLSRGTLEPVFTNYDIAPDSQLIFVRCK